MKCEFYVIPRIRFSDADMMPHTGSKGTLCTLLKSDVKVALPPLYQNCRGLKRDLNYSMSHPLQRTGMLDEIWDVTLSKFS